MPFGRDIRVVQVTLYQTGSDPPQEGEIGGRNPNFIVVLPIAKLLLSLLLFISTAIGTISTVYDSDSDVYFTLATSDSGIGNYCKTSYFRCILISRFWNQKFRCILIWCFPSVLLVFTKPLMGKLNFRRYLISRFYPTRKICENLMHAKNVLQYKTVGEQLTHKQIHISVAVITPSTCFPR